jgi:hypothetical protein
MIRAARHLLTGLRSDRRGVSVVEFAFVAPVVVLFIVGIIDAARGISAKLTLDQAIYRALEKAQVGTVQSDYSFVATEVSTAAAASNITVSNVVVSKWLECDGAETPWDQGCLSSQQTARYVKVSATTNFVPSFAYGRMFLKAGTNGAVPLTSEGSLRMQ